MKSLENDKGHLPIIPLSYLNLYNMIHLCKSQSIIMDSKHSIIKGLYALYNYNQSNLIYLQDDTIF